MAISIKHASLAAAAVIALAGTTASAQRSIQFDLNYLPFQVVDDNGNNAPFGGVNHTGSIIYDVDAGSLFAGVFIKDPPNPYQKQNSFSETLGDVDIIIDLLNGVPTGGSVLVELDNGDSFTADITGGAKVEPFVGGGWKVDVLTSNGGFSDADWGGVPVADFFAAGNTLAGSFLAFKINPEADGSGEGDIDLFHTVPAPGSIACIALAGLVALRRRR
jgi:hypothetical protein